MFAMSSQYVKQVRAEVDYLQGDKHKSWFQHFRHQSFLLSLLMGMIKHPQSNKFAISSQYLTKEVRDGVHFLHADEHKSFYKLELFS